MNLASNNKLYTSLPRNHFKGLTYYPTTLMVKKRPEVKKLQRYSKLPPISQSGTIINFYACLAKIVHNIRFKEDRIKKPNCVKKHNP